MVWSGLEKYYPRKKEYFWPISENFLTHTHTIHTYVHIQKLTYFPNPWDIKQFRITISCCVQCVTRSELVNFYIFDVARGQKRAFCSFEYWELSIILSPQTAVFRVYREGLRREWIKNTSQVPRRQRSVHKVDSRDTERCWMRWEISASTQSFTLRENNPHELQGHDNRCFQTINPKDFLPFAKLRFCGGSFAVITSTLPLPKLQLWIF